jgi:hypothetical protein
MISLISAKPRITEVSEFEKTFRPVVQRPGVRWAPVNRWAKRRPEDAAGNESDQEMAQSAIESWDTKGGS